MTDLRPNRPRRAAVALALLVALGALATAPSASAHTDLVSSDPADGSELAAPPDAAELVFTENIGLELATVALVVDGELVGRPPVTSSANGRGLAIDLSAADVPADAGVASWQMRYRVTAADGHPIEGSVGFDAQGVRDPHPAAPSPSDGPLASPKPDGAKDDKSGSAPADSGPASGAGADDRSSMVVPAIAGGGVLLGLLGLVVVAARRLRASGDHAPERRE